MGYTGLFSSCCAKLGVLLDLGWCSRGKLWICLKEVRPLVLFDGGSVMALDPMLGNLVSSRDELGYMEHFCVAAVTSGSF